MDAYVGQSGFEAAFEEYLHGTDGVKLTTVDTEGNVVSEYFQTEPKAGANVETTIDLNMQIAAETALEQVILELREEGLGQKHEGQDAEGGAVVAIDVKTGQVLACASYPTYTPATYSQDFNQLLKTEWDPLYNRALQATYAPGSVFKMAVTIAAINDGEISSSTTIEDKGVYTKYEDEGYTPQCLIYTNYKQTHGVINVEEALAVSCNYFFYEAGIRTGMPDIDAVAKDLGLGEKTGVELFEEQGHRANAQPVRLVRCGHADAFHRPVRVCIYPHSAGLLHCGPGQSGRPVPGDLPEPGDFIGLPDPRGQRGAGGPQHLPHL